MSEGPLERIPLSPGNESIDQVVNNQALVLDPAYQRGSVWGRARQQNLWRSLMLGLPVGIIVLSWRDDDSLVVVDGKQRIEAVRAFLGGSLDLPSMWFREEAVQGERSPEREVFWDDLTDLGRRLSLRPRLAVFRMDGGTEESERELFDLINFGGLPQGASDLD